MARTVKMMARQGLARALTLAACFTRSSWRFSRRSTAIPPHAGVEPRCLRLREARAAGAPCLREATVALATAAPHEEPHLKEPHPQGWALLLRLGSPAMLLMRS